jgi:hypothetical protein
MSKKIQASPRPRKAYTAPRLVTYGDVRTLTQTGTGSMNETAMAQGMKMPSDRSTKERIVRIGRHPLGIGLYLFDYKPEFRDLFGHGRQFGVIADEVEKVMPQAVSLGWHRYKVVDYAMLGVRPCAQ